MEDREPEFSAPAPRPPPNVGLVVDLGGQRRRRLSGSNAGREERFGLRPERLAADTAYGSAPTLDWLLNERKIAPHIPVIDKSKRASAVLFDRHPFERIVLCRTVANVLSIGLVVRKCAQCSAGKS